MKDTVNVILGAIAILCFIALVARILTPSEYHHRARRRPHPKRRSSDKRPPPAR
jgi:hypothetical protein